MGLVLFLFVMLPTFIWRLSILSYLFLSPDESIEAMPFYWEKDGGSWAITFQPTNDFDLEHLVIR